MRKVYMIASGLVALVVVVCSVVASGTAFAQNVPVYTEQGGARRVIGSGGSLDIASGGEIDIESGGTWKIAGTTVTPSAAELNTVDVATPGTVEASKAVVVDSSKDITGFNILDTVTVTNATLVIESLNPLTVKLNDTNSLQLDNAAISSFAAAADVAGTDVFIESQDGGADTAVDGAIKGGNISLKAGDSGAAGADFDGAAGGSVTFTAGSGTAGGAHTSNNPDGGDGADIALAAGTGGAAGGGGSGVAGAPGKVSITSGLFHLTSAQTIDMSDVQVVLTVNPGTPTGTTVTSNLLFVDANSGSTEDLLLPPEADANGAVYYIANTGGEDIVVKEDSNSTIICTISTSQVGVVFCNGTTWLGGIMPQT